MLCSQDSFATRRASIANLDVVTVEVLASLLTGRLVVGRVGELPAPPSPTRLGMRVIVAPGDVAPIEIDHPALFLSKPGAGALAAARTAEADEAACRMEGVRRAVAAIPNDRAMPNWRRRLVAGQVPSLRSRPAFRLSMSAGAETRRYGN
jgi:hypothetical protein